jgi:hypothetical protein
MVSDCWAVQERAGAVAGQREFDLLEQRRPLVAASRGHRAGHADLAHLAPLVEAHQHGRGQRRSQVGPRVDRGHPRRRPPGSRGERRPAAAPAGRAPRRSPCAGCLAGARPPPGSAWAPPPARVSLEVDLPGDPEDRRRPQRVAQPVARRELAAQRASRRGGLAPRFERPQRPRRPSAGAGRERRRTRSGGEPRRGGRRARLRRQKYRSFCDSSHPPCFDPRARSAAPGAASFWARPHLRGSLTSGAARRRGSCRAWCSN